MQHLNEKSLGPFRPAGLEVQARPGPRAARPVTISTSNCLFTNRLNIRSNESWLLCQQATSLAIIARNFATATSFNSLCASLSSISSLITFVTTSSASSIRPVFSRAPARPKMAVRLRRSLEIARSKSSSASVCRCNWSHAIPLMLKTFALWVPFV